MRGDPTTITQADRELAADIFKMLGKTTIAWSIRGGRFDDSPTVRILAQHRLDAAKIQIGRFRLEPGWTPEHVWIYDGDEGGEFKQADLEAVIATFYKEHF